MKTFEKIAFLAFLTAFTGLSLFAQNKDSPLLSVSKLILPQTGYNRITAQRLNAAFARTIVFADSARFKGYTMAQMKALPNDIIQTLSTVYCNETGKEGFFKYNASPSITVDNTGTRIVTTGGLVLDRLYTGPVSPLWFGAVADGVNNDYTVLAAVLNNFTDVDLGGKTYYLGTQYTTPADRRIKNGTIKIAESAFFRLGARNICTNIKFIGALTSTQQYTSFMAGVASVFASPTYQDNAFGSIAGSDFTHTLTANSLAVGLPSPLTRALSRYVVSSKITLDPAKRYVLTIGDNFIVGNGANYIRFFKTDAAGNELSEYIPNDNFTTNFLQAEGVKIKVGMSRHDHTKLNLSCIFDLSKIFIYECINDLAAIPTRSISEGITGVSIYADDVIVQDCEFSLMKNASLKIVGGRRNIVRNCKVYHCSGGFTTQGGVQNTFENNTIDMRFLDNSGNLLAAGLFQRNHGIGVGPDEKKTVVQCNTITGPAWAVENAEGVSVSEDIRVINNTIDAPHCGISVASLRGIVQNNVIKLSSLGSFGIEIPTAEYVVVEGNTITQPVPSAPTVGIAGSRYLTNARITKNSILANIGIHLTADTAPSDKGIVISDNTVTFYTEGIFSSAGGTNISNNVLKCFSRFSGRLVGVNAGIRCEILKYPHIVSGNKIDGAGTYCIFVLTPKDVRIKDNVCNSFTGNYSDIYITSTNVTDSFVLIDGNEIINPTGQPIAAPGTFSAGSYWKINGNYRSSKNSKLPVNSVTNLPAANTVISSTINSLPKASIDGMTGFQAGKLLYQNSVTPGQIYDTRSTWLKPIVGANVDAVLDFPNIMAGGFQDLTVNVKGATMGQSVSLGLPAAPPAGIVFQVWVSAAGTVTIRETNHTGSDIDPSITTYRVTVNLN